MTITYPRMLPTNEKMQQCWFDIVDNIALSPSAKGKFINLSQINDPVWKGTFETAILDRSQRPIWSAWRKSLRGGLKTFIAYDVRHRYPIAYPSAKIPTDILAGWDGTCSVTALGDAGALSLDGLPVTYQFKIGDRVGLEQGGNYGYYEVMEDVAAVDGAATVTVYPFLHTTVFDTDAVCRVWQAKCQFIIDQTTWGEGGQVEDSSIPFSGLQKL